MLGERNLGEAREPPHELAPPPRPRLRRRRSRQHQRNLGRRCDVHFGAHGADGGHEVDHPADLGLGFEVIEPLELRPWREREQTVAGEAILGRHAPELFGDERGEGMQELEDLVAHPGRHRARFILGRTVGALQHGFGQFEIPVAENIPHEPVHRPGRFVELVDLDRLGDLAHRFAGLVRDPVVERLFGRSRVEARHRDAAVHLREPAGVPQLGREVAVALDALGGKLDVASLRRHRRQREAQRVGPVFIDQLERIDDVAFRLRHFGAALVAHECVDVDGVERHLGHEMQAHHHHARDPEEDDVEAGHQHVGRVVARELRRGVGPAQR